MVARNKAWNEKQTPYLTLPLFHVLRFLQHGLHTSLSMQESTQSLLNPLHASPLQSLSIASFDHMVPAINRTFIAPSLV